MTGAFIPVREAGLSGLVPTREYMSMAAAPWPTFWMAVAVSSGTLDPPGSRTSPDLRGRTCQATWSGSALSALVPFRSKLM